MMLFCKKTYGFTVIEAVVALALGGAFLTSVVATSFFSSKSWNEESLRSKLRYNLVRSTEQIKKDIRLSTGNSILFYPSGASSTTAISIPAATPDLNGFLTIGQSGIVWDKTIVYHVFTNSAGLKELRRTVFNSFIVDPALRQAQLSSVVTSGSGGAGATTSTLFTAETATLEITSENPTFDGYAATTQLSSKTSFGSVPLAAGAHQVRFEVTGKNPASGGFMIGLDSISLNPSGGIQEAERLTVAGDSGRPKILENNSIWGGNFQLEYQASQVADFVTLSTYYDQWLESNFSNMSHSFTAVTGTNPALTILSREDQSLTPAWQAAGQTLGASSNQFCSNKSVRSIVSGSAVTRSGQMTRLRFTAGTDSSLNISEAYFGLRNGATANFLGAPIQLFFDNAAVPVGNPDPVGAMNPGLNPGIVIPAGNTAWSNWFNYPIDASNPVPDFLVSLFVPSGSATAWTPIPPAATQSFSVDGNAAQSVADWSLMPGFQTSQSTFGVTDLATWMSVGVATSQIVDTKLTTPSFEQLTWSSVLPQGSSVAIKVRASGNPDMSGATAWSALAGFVASGANLGGISKLRYLQFQVTLQAANPFTAFPQIDDVKITWPGQTALVEINGTYTKRPNYGVFKVLVDGQNTVGSLNIKVTAKDIYRGKVFTASLMTQAKPRNTGK